jgi:hypothetical protein
VPTQAEKAARFLALHQRPEPFVVANPWDAGTARILTGLGFETLSTTSAGLAFTLGRKDGTASVSRAEALANAKDIAEATALPVAADLENGYGHSPEEAAETIRLAAETADWWAARSRTPQATRLVRSTIQPCRGRVAAAPPQPRSSLPFHVRGARRELSARPSRPRRHDPQTAGL